MASIATGKVVPSPGGLLVTYFDTGSYGAVSSRLLTVFDADGNIFAGPYTMGSNLSQAVPVTDQYLQFFCVVNDDVAGSPWTAQVNFGSEGEYVESFLNRVSTQGCACPPNKQYNLFEAEMYLTAFDRFCLSALGPAANTMINIANTLINTP